MNISIIRKMNYTKLYCLKNGIRLLKKNWNHDISRHASTGVNLWERDISNDIRHKIEDYWKEKVLTRQPEDDMKEKYYVLSMFPYPSGSLHMGHVRVYSISDSVARFHKMRGKNVIHPMGWDAFGLPAENAAIERNIDPAEWTEKNIANMKEQLKMMGCDFDWEREVATCHPEYYQWTQELFLKLYERGLAYQSEAFVNWDPVDQTVLADEQVDHDGKSWRSGAKVEKKLLKQWFVKTTSFAKSLLEGLNDPILKEWRDIIKIQKHWIGPCNGTTINFELISDLEQKPSTLSLWTDTPEFIEHVKFVAVSRDNFLAKAQLGDCKNVDSKFLNAYVINPFTGEQIPIYYSNSIEFNRIRDNYLGIPGVSEIAANFCDSVGIKYEQLEQLSPEESEKQRHEVMEEARKKEIGGYPVSVSLRDWLISRQRYWGTPIPIIHCKSCGARPVPRDQLPVILPKKSESNVEKKIPNLREAVDWLKTTCPDCGKDALREPDTMDTFVDSSWYFMRYIDSKNKKEMFSTDKAFKCLPVDLYIGGKEHAALHLYYARFINHFLHSEGLVPTREPFKQLLVQGMVMGMSYRVKGSGKYLKPEEVEKREKNYVEKSTELPVIASWEKMSKSKHNGVDPMDMFHAFGADTTRLIILADVAPISNRNWSDHTFPGVLNWQNRLWIIMRKFLELRKKTKPGARQRIPQTEEFKKHNDYMYDSRNYYVKGVTYNITTSQHFSVAISKMQGLTNSTRKVGAACLTHSREYERALAAQIVMLAPLAPQFASELWAGFCSAPYHLASDDPCIQIDKDVLEQIWPSVDMDYKLDLDVFVSGNNIAVIKIPRNVLDVMTADEAASIASESTEVRDYLQGRPINGFRFISEPGCDAKIFLHLKAREKAQIQSTG